MLHSNDFTSLPEKINGKKFRKLLKGMISFLESNYFARMNSQF